MAFTPLSTLSQWLDWATAELAGSESAKLDARVLLCHCLDCSETYLYTWPDKALSEQQARAFQASIQSRKAGTPVAHLLGKREFWSLELTVNPSTLIPRPDTEVLVEAALACPVPENARVLDLGTGTGAIALALASERPQWQIVAVDVVDEAVALAEHNRARHQLNNVTVQRSHWFDGIEQQAFDLIVSNPPYVEEQSLWLQQGDVRFEPRSALTAGDDGLDDIRLICKQAPQYLAPQGWLMIEHGFEQHQAVQALMAQAGLEKCRSERDLAGLYRISMAQKNR
ncbi:peptide chain release factor N(5)-glutamine methyltransferase [Aestuariibacter halophilus]|uniref:Release factor glutamine methyltransferase n=1 Tax=Fluctibacter halophilus TaxID=226011 RepID=A0ABS8G675_9ALTE|nr:peptide chain release factor N(5)-glutamine methyltransferase [Aestuariibacter halophilus]MCC2616018.1 peptide chain release factor N(5)-glutamine methyltransferase [Aestuariibacter halophilus]